MVPSALQDALVLCSCFFATSLHNAATKAFSPLYFKTALYITCIWRLQAQQTPTIPTRHPIPHHRISLSSNAYTTILLCYDALSCTEDPLSPIIQINTPKTVSPMTPIFLTPRSGRLLTKHWYVPVSDSWVLLMKMEALVVGIVTANPTRP